MLKILNSVLLLLKRIESFEKLKFQSLRYRIRTISFKNIKCRRLKNALRRKQKLYLHI